MRKRLGVIILSAIASWFLVSASASMGGGVATLGYEFPTLDQVVTLIAGTDGGSIIAPAGWVTSFDCDVTNCANLTGAATLPDGGCLILPTNTPPDGGFIGADGGAPYGACGFALAATYYPTDAGGPYIQGGIGLQIPGSYGALSGETFTTPVLGFSFSALCPGCSPTTPFAILYNVTAGTLADNNYFGMGIGVPLISYNEEVGPIGDGALYETYVSVHVPSTTTNGYLGATYPPSTIGTVVASYPQGMAFGPVLMSFCPAYSGSWPNSTCVNYGGQHNFESTPYYDFASGPAPIYWQVFAFGALGGAAPFTITINRIGFKYEAYAQ